MQPALRATIRIPIAPNAIGKSATNIFAFRWLLLYFAFAATLGVGFIVVQRRQAATIESNNAFLSSISTKLSRYLSPQIFQRIFSGDRDVTIATERKKLTIFFSDIKDFTSTTERLQPEELTTLLNEYFTAMSEIALHFGGTIDKFVGDAILIFFGDPETKGVEADARAAVHMAVAMQARIAELNAIWRRRGVEEPFRVRMGINTGYCNVGNFGSIDRMDYTIIGGEANLSARLQAIADPGRIVVSYETYALVREMLVARPLAPLTVKGIAREIVPYVIDGLREGSTTRSPVFAEHAPGIDIYLDIDRIDATNVSRVRSVLAGALAELDGNSERNSPGATSVVERDDDR